MLSKLKKYHKHLQRFVNSQNKNQLLSEFYQSVLTNGFISGTQSFLHQKNLSVEIDDSNYLSNSYDSIYQENQKFSNNTDIKTLAFYLPQFHAIKENNEWWGNGFVEWVNTKKCKPRFNGHYQPREPHNDIGYYDLLDINTLVRQVKLAKDHGVYGFCFYYYWFSGQRLLEKPVDMLLQHPEIDINFCLCWANENWTRAWDGRDKQVLMSQKYSKLDREQFITDLKKYTDDKRYIKIDGKPVIIVYNPGHIPDIIDVFMTWRETAKKIGIGDILIWTCATANNSVELLNIENVVDAEVAFPPHNMWFDDTALRNLDLNGKSAYIYHYKLLVDKLCAQSSESKRSTCKKYKTAMLGWDNAARREDGWFTFYGFSLKSFYNWLRHNISYTRNNFEENERFMFVNAWNEWAEGTYLEPDKKYGYSSINTFSKAIYDLPFDDNVVVFTNENIAKQDIISSKKFSIAVQIHLFYLDLIDEIISYTNNIPFQFDCIISTDSDHKRDMIRNAFAEKSLAVSVVVDVYENRGRDVLPFINQILSCHKHYDYICHIHSKKTKTDNHGDLWRKYLFSNLLGSQEIINNILSIFDSDSNVGLIFPETYPLLTNMAEWGGNKDMCYDLLNKLNIRIDLPDNLVFPVGNMFWVRKSSVEQIFKSKLSTELFPSESGQVNLTPAHAIERLWVYINAFNGFSYKKTINFSHSKLHFVEKRPKRICFYAHYDKNDALTSDDIFSMECIGDVVDVLIVISNSCLSKVDIDRLSIIASTVIVRENLGYDFGAWKAGITEYSFDKIDQFDEVILMNNSISGPYCDLSYILSKMTADLNIDFWGMTLFPRLDDGTFLNMDYIPEHLQSYFIVFKKPVLCSTVFKEFWSSIKLSNSYKDTIVNGEISITTTLSKSGFSYKAYIQESKLMPFYLNNFRLLYEYPSKFILLGLPFVKKKSINYTSEDEKIYTNWLIKQA